MKLEKILGIGLILYGIISITVALVFGGLFYFVGDAIGNSGISEQEWEEFEKNALTTEGTVTNTNSGTTVKYRAEDNSIYNVHLDMTSSSYPVGKKVTVYYDKYDPAYAMVPEITENTTKFLHYSFSGMGIIAGVVFAFSGLISAVAGFFIVCSKKK